MEAAASQRGSQQRLTADGGDFGHAAVPRGLLHGACVLTRTNGAWA